LIRTHIKGCSDCQGGGCAAESDLPQDLPVMYHDALIGWIDSMRVKSVDVTGDGVVDALENDGIGRTYNKQPDHPSFNSCYDYTGNGRVNLSDLGVLGTHYNDCCPALGAFPVFAELVESKVGVRFVTRQPDAAGRGERLSVTVYLENACRLSSIAMGLRNDIPSFEYAGWLPDPDCPAVTAVVPVKRRGRNELFLSVYGMETVCGSSIELGTLEYLVTGEAGANASLTPCAEDFALVFGDAVDTEGGVERIAGAEYVRETPAYRNHLGNAYPNPFNPNTTIEYAIRERGHVSLRIYNVAGQLVKTLVDEVQEPTAGVRTVLWNGRCDTGRPVSSGVYFYRLDAPGFRQTKKMVLLR
jgi:hypothetical protein